MSRSSPAPPTARYENEKTQRWSRVVDEFDGFVFVTPEYNHSVPAAMKNAFDVLGPEWQKKAVAFVAYGADGGVRAVEHWRSITANMSMPAARSQVSLSLFTDFGEHGFVPDRSARGRARRTARRGRAAGRPGPSSSGRPDPRPPACGPGPGPGPHVRLHTLAP